jgi:hypothetical protein
MTIRIEAGLSRYSLPAQLDAHPVFKGRLSGHNPRAQRSDLGDYESWRRPLPLPPCRQIAHFGVCGHAPEPRMAAMRGSFFRSAVI